MLINRLLKANAEVYWLKKSEKADKAMLAFFEKHLKPTLVTSAGGPALDLPDERAAGETA